MIIILFKTFVRKITENKLNAMTFVTEEVPAKSGGLTTTKVQKLQSIAIGFIIDNYINIEPETFNIEIALSIDTKNGFFLISTETGNIIFTDEEGNVIIDIAIMDTETIGLDVYPNMFILHYDSNYINFRFDKIVEIKGNIEITSKYGKGSYNYIIEDKMTSSENTESYILEMIK